MTRLGSTSPRSHSPAWIGIFLAAAFLATPLLAAFPAPPGGSYDFTAVTSGPWHEDCTWHPEPQCSSQVLAIPSSTSKVLIPSGKTVNIQSTSNAYARFIRVEGSFKMWIHSSTRLLVETIYVAPNGSFEIGAVNNPVKTGRKAEIIFTGTGAIDLSWDPDQLSRGLVSDGTVKLYGIRKKHMLTLTGEASAGDDVLSLSANTIISSPSPAAAYEAWLPDDEVVVAGTYFLRQLDPDTTSSRDDRQTIDSVSGSTVTLVDDLDHDHRRAIATDTSQKIHVVNITRNIVFSSQDADDTEERGHVMFRRGNGSGVVDIRHVAFVGLGRTDKRIPLDDFDVEVDGGEYSIDAETNSLIQNRRGRYSVHFHKRLDLAGSFPATADIVWDSVVVDAIGWGFVNHSSYVDFERNVAYDFNGAGFVTEAGNELGTFEGNLAIRGHGNNEFRPVRIVFANGDRRQPLSDFAFSGDGFWFQGPAIRAIDNVASGCDGAGMIWFTTGAPEVLDTYTVTVGSETYTHNRYTYFPRAWLSSVYGSGHGLVPRHWSHGSGDERVVISDLPILEMDGFDAYGNLVGFRLRFNNQWNTDWYTEDPFDYDEEIVVDSSLSCPPPNDKNCAVRNRQNIDSLRLWNNEQGFRVRYATKTDWDDVTVVNRLAYSDPRTFNPDLYVGHAGAEINFQMQDTTLAGVTIDGYPVAGWIENASTGVRGLTCFEPQCPTTNWATNYADYSNYANKDTWKRSLDNQCGTPTSPWHGSVTTNSASLSWSAGANNSRYLVRYRVQGEDHWTPAPATGSPKTISGLTSQTTYEFQVVAGCSVSGSEALSLWSTTDTFTTN